jgi:hypothetical protein
MCIMRQDGTYVTEEDGFVGTGLGSERPAQQIHSWSEHGVLR